MTDQARPEDALVGLDLEAGMEAAFDGDSVPAPADGSVLAQLMSDGHDVVPVLLRDEESEADMTPVVRPASGEMLRGGSGRYRVVGEIARGGVGVILKGQDVDLGRDVAMKVIRKEHEDNADMVQRFVEEAQIGGQLQHPGIVPVYEVGLGEDRRPYFTMKLVKGRTLSSLLRKRASPAKERRRFVRIFESVCQTMGYAHARGVIHRDLKPSNVMVGAFGEVLVVDWGMGKVLRSGGVDDERSARLRADQTVVTTHRSGSEGSGSVIGSVMGTPRYMPPEQARGDIDRVNEQSDVFGLGAILCEILTGQPPYTGEGREALAQAAMAKLDDSNERLEACGGDAELVEIAKRCLSPAQAARPANAGELAGLVSGYLEGLEERLEQTKLAAVRAEESAAAAQELVEHEQRAATKERKARRVTTTLAIAIIAILVVGGGFLLIHREEKQRKQAATATQVDWALSRAAFLAEHAEQDQHLPSWAQAQEAARSAKRVLDAGTGDPALAQRVDLALSKIEPRAAKAGAYLAGLEDAAKLDRDGDEPAALAVYDRLTSEMPDVALAHVRRGKVLVQMGLLEDALAALERASSLRKTPETESNRASVLASLLRYEEARLVLREAMAAFPTNPEVINGLANLLPEERGHERTALFYRAVLVDPEHGPAQFNLRTRYKKAAADGDERILRGDLMPKDGECRRLLALLCGQARRHQDAVRLWELAFEAAPASEDSLIDGHINRMAAAIQAIMTWVSAKELTRDERFAYLDKALSWMDAHLSACEENARTVDPPGAAHLLRGFARFSSLPGQLLRNDALRPEDRKQLEAFDKRFTALWVPTGLRLCKAEDLAKAARGMRSALVAQVAGPLILAGHPVEALRLYDTAQAMDLDWHQRWVLCYNAGCAALRVFVETGPDAETAKALRTKAGRWLSLALDGLEKLSTAEAKPYLENFHKDSDLAPGRSAAIDAMPSDEQSSWRSLWKRVDELLK